MISTLACAAALALAPAAERPTDVAVSGQVRSAGERTPVVGARVFATPRGRRATDPAWIRETTSLTDGSFVLADLPTREIVLTIVAPGHERFEQPTPAGYWSRRRPPVIYLQPTGAGRYRTIVVAGPEERQTTTVERRLAPDEVSRVPGSQGDPLRALQNMPGVARVPGGLGLLVLRGATPAQSQVFYGEHPLPRAFHMIGLSSVVPGEVLGGIRYVPGNFDGAYGNAVGGIVVLAPRTGRRDGIHGHAKLDLISAGTRVEGPMHRGSFLVAVQRGYLDWALRKLEPLTGPFIQPSYHDYQVIFEHPVGPGATVTTRFLGAGDRVGVDPGTHPFNLGGVELRSSFHRLDLAYRKRQGAWSFLLAPALRLDRASVGRPTMFTRRNDVVGLLRAELTAQPSQRFVLTVGADTQLDRFTTYDYDATDEDVEPTSTRGRGFASNSGVYATATLTLGALSLSPGVRLSAFTSGASRAFAVDPRLLARWAPHERFVFSVGAGLYSQPVVLRRVTRLDVLPGYSWAGEPYKEISTVVYPSGDGLVVLPGAIRYLDPRLEFDPSSPVGASRALHLSASAHAELPGGLDLDAAVFFRGVHDNFAGAAAPTGSRAHGVELMLRRALGRRLRGWIAYSWMRATQGVVDRTRLTERSPADFDQRHNIVAVLLLALPRRWELGARFRVVTGLPFTPFVGSVHMQSAYEDNYFPLRGAENSARMPVFHQLDLRLDKTWVLRRTIVSGYIDVQNVYNKQNAEGLIYNRYFTDTSHAVGVPILPVLGVRCEY